MSDGTFTSLGKVRWEVGRVGSLVALNNVPFSHTLLSLCVADSHHASQQQEGGRLATTHQKLIHTTRRQTIEEEETKESNQTKREKIHSAIATLSLSYISFLSP